MDFSISSSLPLEAQKLLEELIIDYKEENLTPKGYLKKRQLLLDSYKNVRSPSKSIKIHKTNGSLLSSSTASFESMSIISPEPSLYKVTTTTSSNNNNSSNIIESKSPLNSNNNNNNNNNSYNDNENSLMVMKNKNNPSNNNKLTPASSTSLRISRTNTSASTNNSSNNKGNVKRRLSQISLPFSPDSGEYDPMTPLLPRVEKLTSTFKGASLPAILRARSQLQAKETALIIVNHKNKETVISWEKLYLRSEKIAHELSKSKSLYKMDKVLLWFNRDDVIEFAVSLFGCFISGMIAVPVSFETYSLNEIIEIVKLTNSKTIIISEDASKQLTNLTTSNGKLKLIKSDFFSKITFVKSSDMGIYSKAKKIQPIFDIPSISYIEFTRTPLGKLSGVVMKHKILENQFETFSSIINSRLNSLRASATKKTSANSIIRPLTASSGGSARRRFITVNTLDTTRNSGLVLGLLFNIYTGNLMVSGDSKHILTTSGGFETLIDKYRADIILSDQLQLKQVVINYLDNPEVSSKKRKQRVDFSCIKFCFTTCTTIDTDVSEMIVHKWLKNLGGMDASQCYSPILTLPDFGGIFISLKDQLGKLENFPLHDPKLRLQDDLFIEKEVLKENIIKPSITAMINASSSTQNFIRLASFGYPIPDSYVAIVNPDDGTLVQDLTVGEVWISSPTITDEFYQMDKVNEFVFNAKINYTEMFRMLRASKSSSSIVEKLRTIMTTCTTNLKFLRTKLMGFVHNGRIFILSLVEDMILQNKLIRLPNWSHTSDLTKSKNIEKKRRLVQTHYLQHITENLVRTVEYVLEVSAFELPQNKDEHFLVMCVESTYLRNSALTIANNDSVTTVGSSNSVQKLEKTLNALLEKIYKILWIFHKIQPFCIMLLPPGSLPKRYCSLEIANSIVEKKFFSGELNSKFVKFQLDNVILDFVPHSSYYNESIFSEHLSELRHKAIGQNINQHFGNVNLEKFWQTSGIDFRDKTVDTRSNIVLTSFTSIMDILQWRSKNQPNDFAFSDGQVSGSGGSLANNNGNNYHKNVSWRQFDNIVASFLKKIIDSKTPLKAGDPIVIIAENSVEYAAMVNACFYCGFLVIPLPVFKDSTATENVLLLVNIVKSYKVKRIFVDGKHFTLLDDNTLTSKMLKKYKNEIPKITNFSKIKKRQKLLITDCKTIMKSKYKYGRLQKAGCVIWIDKETDINLNTNVVMNHPLLLNMCKIIKETLKMSSDTRILSCCRHTNGIGFLQSCLLGIYVGTTTTSFSSSDIYHDITEFLIALQNLNIKDLYLSPEFLTFVLQKANEFLTQHEIYDKRNNDSKIKNAHLKPFFLKNVANIIVPFSGRPRTDLIESLIRKYPQIGCTNLNVNYLYEHRFNPFVSVRSYLGIPPVHVYLDPESLREGTIKEVDPHVTNDYICLQDSGIVPVCTLVSIVNPETRKLCYSGEIGEIWCCSEENSYDYYIANLDQKPLLQNKAPSNKAAKTYKLQKEKFITSQFNSKINNGGVNDSLTYLRTGDLGFMRSFTKIDDRGNKLNLALLYVLGGIHETIENLGLTHFVVDLEKTIINTHASIANCMVAKVGGFLSCIVEMKKEKNRPEHSNIVSLIVAMLLKKHGVILDLCCFAKCGALTSKYFDWHKNRRNILTNWINKNIVIEDSYGTNFGENTSLYLLSDFETQK
ncbi:Cmr2p SCDLUD_002923 [Saccharomycodes ludwigii]|uniref:Cmr2p n=1 Tax=Saccharomycodes ludwigii TaxID=36035 RepID=UPI001E840689|nr:hypothetical protein SCDLUD_002923 [Saccharomycodes ludwigii]KAH3901430.1 hypothetical protein SCDLUD_002923 [Saccharomycodes ludwigii]